MYICMYVCMYGWFHNNFVYERNEIQAMAWHEMVYLSDESTIILYPFNCVCV